MAINDTLLELGIERLSAIEGIVMDADRLVDDVVLLAYVFDDPKRFSTALAHVINALHLIVSQRRIGHPLVNNKAGWWSYHFQSQRTQRHKADMRIVYQDTGTTIRIMGFGPGPVHPTFSKIITSSATEGDSHG